MSTFSLGRSLKCLALVAGIWASSFGAAELGFRALGDHPSADMKGLYEAFAGGSYKLAPSVDTSADWASGPFSVHTDGLGLRCDPARVHGVRPGEKLDILFVGDSQGFGNGVNYEDTIVGAVAAGAGHENWTIGNTSVGGHYADNQFELVRWLAESKRVTARNYVLLITPGMAMNCEEYNRAVVGPDGRLYDKPKSSFELLKIYCKHNSTAYSRVRNALRNMGIGDAPTTKASWIFQLYGNGEGAVAKREALRRFLEKFRQFAARQNATFTLAYVPLTVEVDFDAVSQAAAQNGVSVGADLPFHTCEGIAKELHIPIVSLRPVLEAAREKGGSLHLKGDYHYSQELSRACGERLWTDLKSHLSAPDMRLTNDH